MLLQHEQLTLRLDGLKSRIEQLEKEVQDTEKVEDSDINVEDIVEVPKQLTETMSTLYDLFTTPTEHSLSAQHARLEKIDSLLQELDSNTLLFVDLHRKRDELSSEIFNRSQKTWAEAVYFGPGEMKLSFNEDADFIANEDVSLRAECVAEVYAFVQKLSSLQVSKVRKADEHRIAWENTAETEVVPFFDSLTVFLQFISQCKELNVAIAARSAASFAQNVTNIALPTLLLQKTNKNEVKTRVTELSKLMQDCGWQRSLIGQFVGNFDTIYLDIRRSAYLGDLRSILLQPIKKNLIDKPPSTNVEEDEESGWDWNDDEEEEDANNAESTGSGKISVLWELYSAEMPETQDDPFVQLFCALAPSSYGEHNLLLYEDAMRFSDWCSGDLSSELAALAQQCLQDFVSYWRTNLENKFLPALFSVRAQNPVKVLIQQIDEIANLTNQAGGVELRQSVLSRLVEQTSVYVISTILQVRDIGEEASQQYAQLIAKLNPLALYFSDIGLLVPSWNKLEVLGEILTSNLAHIREMNDQAKLLDFSKTELRGLIVALFVDSSIRRQVINEVCR